MEVLFKLQKETKGALRYQEVDEKGEPIESPWAKIGTLYMLLHVTVEAVETR
jgi:hypothetical protein